MKFQKLSAKRFLLFCKRKEIEQSCSKKNIILKILIKKITGFSREIALKEFRNIDLEKM